MEGRDSEICYSIWFKEIKETDEMKTCFTCDKEFSPEEFLDHLNSNRHKLYVKIEQNELKCLKAKMENWLETGIFHKV